MRREFSEWMERFGAECTKSVFLTGDLGFMALESVRERMGERFLNVGVAEQNMISVAAGLAKEGLLPFCYSIAAFLVFRPFEQIRLDVCLHNLNVKLVGNGGGYGYGIMGATHHALEDLAVLSALPNMKCYVPFCNEDVFTVCDAMMERSGPSYLRLGYGSYSSYALEASKFVAVRKLRSGDMLTVVGIGPVLLNTLQALDGLGISCDVFVVSEFPPNNWGGVFESIAETGHVLVVEEHVIRGGLGEALALCLVQSNIQCCFKSVSAVGYPDGLYGSQAYHQARSGLDTEGLRVTIKGLVYG